VRSRALFAYTPAMDRANSPTVAVVGCGRWGRNIVRDLIELGCSVVVIDVSDDSRRLGKQLGAVASHSCLADHVGDPLDGIVVAAPTSQHASLSLEALSFGVPVFVEKPLTDDPASAMRLVSAGGDRLFVMHKWHYHPGVEALGHLVASGRLGTIIGVESERTGTANPSPDTDAIWLLGPHEISFGRRILGCFPDSITGVADVTTAGVVGVDATARWADGRWHRWCASVRPSATRRTIVVHGSAGRAVLERPDAPYISVRDCESPDVEVESIAVSTELPLIRQLRLFRDHLDGGAPPPTTGADGLAVVLLLSALREAAGLSAAGSVLPAGPGNLRR